MNARVIRKAIGLLIVDIVIIIGIFILQFRTDSSILKKFGNFQITMAKAQDENAPYELENKLEISYNGINIHTDNQDSIKILKKGEAVAQPVRLIEYIEEELQYTFKFTEDLSLVFMLDQNNLEAPLTIFADVPKEITDVYVPFNFAYNMKVQKDEGNKIVLEGKKQTWSFHTDSITDNCIHFTYADNLAHYSIYDDTKKFSFEDLIQLAAAEKSEYDRIISTFNSNLINTFKASISDSSFTEQAVIAYIAAMSKEGKFQQAIDDIPSDYKKSSSRTYLSAPFLNTLADMNKKLESSINEINKDIKAAADSSTLDIFTMQNIASWLCIYPESGTVNTILKNAASADITNCTIDQINGLMLAFADFTLLHKEYADALEPVIEPCIQKLTDACTYENNILTISENDTFLSVVQAAQSGIALMRYGLVKDNQTYIKAGRVIVNSYLAESTSFDLRTLAALYPLLQYDNYYYPHIELINSYGKNAVWAWTCAKQIVYSKDDQGAMNLAIDFPMGLTHYVIFKGIPAFEQIFIYDMAFRTDPRFETYNSSGYVYRAETDTLLLKSRHKSQIENVRMSYTPVARPAPAPAPAPAPKPAEPEPESEPAATSSATTESEAIQTEPAPQTTPEEPAI